MSTSGPRLLCFELCYLPFHTLTPLPSQALSTALSSTAQALAQNNNDNYQNKDIITKIEIMFF